MSVRSVEETAGGVNRGGRGSEVAGKFTPAFEAGSNERRRAGGAEPRLAKCNASLHANAIILNALDAPSTVHDLQLDPINPKDADVLRLATNLQFPDRLAVQVVDYRQCLVEGAGHEETGIVLATHRLKSRGRIQNVA